MSRLIGSIMTLTHPTASTRRSRLSRRHLLAGAAAAALLPTPAVAQLEAFDDGTGFSFDALSDAMRRRSAKPDAPASVPDGVFNDLTYDTYRLIRFRGDRALWQNGQGGFHLLPFHLGMVVS